LLSQDQEGKRESKPKPRTEGNEAIEARVREGAEDGKLPCAVAFKIAEEMKVSRLAVGEAADRLGVRISRCQLGCFR
jgi:LAO/AO transport system kinase